MPQLGSGPESDSVPQGVELWHGAGISSTSPMRACGQIAYESKTRLGHQRWAYTAVDFAPNQNQDPGHGGGNASAPGPLPEALAELAESLLQVSTDFASNGRQAHPYDPPKPCSRWVLR